MAENKKSFLLYCDIQHTVKKLSNEQAGELFKHILSYVNDENPTTENVIIDLVFEPIKQALKRDLRRYESICQRNSDNGKKGGRPPKTENPQEPKKPTGLFGNPENPDEPKKADSDIDSDIDIENDVNKKTILTKEEKKAAAIAATKLRKKEFSNHLKEFVSKYPKEMINSFFEYWSEMNKSGTKMKFEIQETWETNKRLATWYNKGKTDLYVNMSDNEKTEYRNNILNKLYSDTSWINTTSDYYLCTDVKLKNTLLEFLNKIKATEEIYKPIHEIKKHFINWNNRQKQTA